MKKYLAIDVGGTDIKYATMDGEANIISQGKKPTLRESIDDFLSALDTIVLPVKDEVEGIAMSMPGRIDNKTGYCYTGGALSNFLINVPMGEILNKRYNLPVSIENDGKCAVLAEAWKGNLSDVDSGITIVLGSGIGGGILLNKKVWRGATGSSGEVSLLATDFNQLGEMSSFWAMKNGVYGLIFPYAAAKGVDASTIDGKVFFNDLLNGDEVAKGVFENYIKTLLAGIVNIQAILDVEKICIGGGISAQDILIQAIQAAVKEFFIKIQGQLPVMEPKIDRCKFRNDANLIGALKNFFDQQ